jgi:hypothetical protein
LDFAHPPEALTRRQRAIVIAVALVCAASRFLAMARSLWEWDEALFTMAMRDYDVTMHHPHPPGFPVYIAMAKVARLVIPDDFRALQSINLLFGMLAFLAVFFFARELRVRFSTAVSAGALFAFFPNVWFFGGTAFSDIPAIVLVLFAVTLLFAGVRNRNAYWLGTLLLALSMGIRPQNILVGLIPGILATRKRRWWEIAVALLIGIVVVGVAFGGAVYATVSWDQYMRLVREHGDYIARIDSFRSDARPPLWRIFDRFFIKQYQSPVLSVIASLFAVVSIVGAIRQRSRAMLWNALTFVPFAIFAWLMLDRFSISRFSIGYQPMFALFVADGICRVARKREWVLSAAMVAAFFIYTFPALTTVRDEIAPSILAARATARQVDPAHDQLFVAHTMMVFMDLEAPNLPYTRVVDDRAMPVDAKPRSWLHTEITTTREEGQLFRREHDALWSIARRHYFDIKLTPLNERPHFVSGWYAPESMETNQWRWMSGRSVTMLPAVNGEALLRLSMGMPAELIAKHPTVTLTMNGRVVERIPMNSDSLERDFHVNPAPGGLPNLLELSIDRTVSPAHESRELGLRLKWLAWGPA